MRDSREVLVFEDLRHVLQGWEPLHGERVPGSRRRWNQTDQTDGQLDRQHARQEREIAEDTAERQRGREVRPHGVSPAPLRVDVLDAIVLITTDVLDAEWITVTALGQPPPNRPAHHPTRILAGTGYRPATGPVPALPRGNTGGRGRRILDTDGSPDPRVPLAARNVQRNLTDLTGYDDALRKVERRARRAARATRVALGLEPRRHRLGMPCPDCGYLGLVALFDADPPVINHPRTIGGCGSTWPRDQWSRAGLGFDEAIADAIATRQALRTPPRTVNMCTCRHSQLSHGPACTAVEEVEHVDGTWTRDHCSCTCFQLATVRTVPAGRKAAS